MILSQRVRAEHSYPEAALIAHLQSGEVNAPSRLREDEITLMMTIRAV
jgi:hypothetical protein